jgi:uncharacterized protein YyaL (SSP411 family)
MIRTSRPSVLRSTQARPWYNVRMNRPALFLIALFACSALAEENPAAPGLSATPLLTKQLGAALLAKGAAFHPHTRHLDARGRPLFTNRLILQTSPYLLQHANNPVSWYAWGDEPFARSSREKKPVFLSIGYSTCHWCHVMERESFEDLEVARYLNENFVAIKVDREERPDVDGVYMAAVELLTGEGGWPMTTALTPERKPFFGGTYFPKQQLLAALVQIKRTYDEHPDTVESRATQLSLAIEQNARPAAPADLPSGEALRDAAAKLAQQYDPVNGGFGKAPKFPTPANLTLLARYYRRTGDSQALLMVMHTLEQMAKGGIHDQLGGGFHRYSTDPQWLKPHFEKMLYDNAQLAIAYLEGYQLTGRKDFALVARETLDYIAREMTAANGGFYSAGDADSPGLKGEPSEGYFFTWTPREVEAVLGREHALIFNELYGVTPGGEVDGRSILYREREIADVAKEHNLAPAALETEVIGFRKKLLAARASRAAPAVDHKIVTEWNGLTISAFARAGFAFREPRYLAQAARAAEFLWSNSANGTHLTHSWNGSAQGEGFLEDHAAVEQAFLDLFEATGEARWLERAAALQNALDAHFRDAQAGGYFLASDQEKGLLVREKPGSDGVTPAGNSLAALNLFRLAELRSDDKLRARGLEVLRAFVSRLPAMPTMLGALDEALHQPMEVVVVRLHGQDASSLLEPLRSAYLPGATRVVAEEGSAPPLPLMEGKRALHGQPTAFVCRNRVCALPTSDPATFAAQLQKTEPLFADRSPAPLAIRPP